MPKKGWLNDPNGLVYFKGEYHIFYQADEESLLGHVNKAWGHYSTKDFITYKQHELAILPDSIPSLTVEKVKSARKPLFKV